MPKPKLHQLDQSGATDGQVATWNGGEWAPADTGAATALTVKEDGTPVDTAVTSIDLTGAAVTAVSDGSGHVTVAILPSLVPLTTVIDGVPDLVWDADNQLVMTEAP